MSGIVTVSPEAKMWLAGIAPMLRADYMAKWKDLSEQDLWLAIEKKYGERIMTEVCIPRKVTNLVCLLIAAAICRGE